MRRRGNRSSLVARIRRSSRQAGVFVALAAGASSVAACSLLLDWTGYTGGLNDGGRTESEAAVSIPCGTDEHCAAVLANDAGWSAPLTLYAAGSTPPGCGNGFESFYEFGAGPAACSACSCSPPDGGTCGPPGITFYGDGGCLTPCGHQPLVNMACVPPMCGSSFTIGSSNPTGGGCVPTGGAATLPTPWKLAGVACPPNAALSSGSCSADRICLPTPSTPAAPRICVRSSGEATSCPGAPYIFGPEVYYADAQAADTRACSACSCGSPAGASCPFDSVVNITNIRFDSACMFPIVTPR